jgi:hypothetical protein
MRTLKTLSLVGLILAPIFAIAAGPASTMTGDISKADFIKQAEARFTALDTNKDGKISTEERQAQRRGRGMGPGASMPAEITREQHLKFAEERFAALDANKDGKVTVEERRAQRGQFAEGKGRKGGKHGGQFAGGGRGMGPGASMPAEMTREQHLKFAEERFATLDANKDGKVTQEERQAQRNKYRAERQQRRASLPAAK